MAKAEVLALPMAERLEQNESRPIAINITLPLRQSQALACGLVRYRSKVMSREGWPDLVFAFHDGEEIGPRMLARIAKQRASPRDL
jgi:hypothetical protein